MDESDIKEQIKQNELRIADLRLEQADYRAAVRQADKQIQTIYCLISGLNRELDIHRARHAEDVRVRRSVYELPVDSIGL